MNKNIFLHTSLFAVVCLTLACTHLLPSSPATTAVSLYGSAPKGLTMEGVATGIESVKSVTYDRRANRFTINSTNTYSPPVARRELVHLAQALSRDDRLGISLLHLSTGEFITYGALGSRSRVARNLVKADKFLGAVVFVWDDVLKGHRLPQNYKPQAPDKKALTCVAYFNMTDFRFSLNEKKNEYIRNYFDLTVMLIPIKTERGRDGGFQLDDSPNAQNKIRSEHRNNVAHIRDNIDAYKKMKVISAAAAYAEAAAFLRFLRENNINLKKLAKSM